MIPSPAQTSLLIAHLRICPSHANFIPTSPIASSSPRHTNINSSQHSQPPTPPPATPPPANPPVAAPTPTLPLAPPHLPFDLNSIFTQRIPTLRRVSKAAQREMASLKTAVWNSVLSNPDSGERSCLDSCSCSLEAHAFHSSGEEKLQAKVSRGEAMHRCVQTWSL